MSPSYPSQDPTIARATEQVAFLLHDVEQKLNIIRATLQQQPANPFTNLPFQGPWQGASFNAQTSTNPSLTTLLSNPVVQQHILSLPVVQQQLAAIASGLVPSTPGGFISPGFTSGIGGPSFPGGIGFPTMTPPGVSAPFTSPFQAPFNPFRL